MTTAKQLANLQPIRPGEVRNPKGRNQYSYRRDFEAAIGRLAAGKYAGRSQACEDADLECVFCGLQKCERLAAGLGAIHEGCLRQVRKMTCGDVLAHVTWRRALSGDPRILPETLRRVWPALDRQEDREDESLVEQLDRAIARAKARGD